MNVETTHDVVSKAYDSLASANESAANPAAAPAAVEPAAVEVVSSETPGKDEPIDRSRDEQGRFAKKAKEEAEAKAKAAEPTKAEPVAEVKAEAPKAEALKAPQSWKPAIREKFAALPPEIQQEVLRREGEITKTMQERADDSRTAQSFRQTLAPYDNLLRQWGPNPAAALSAVLQAANSISASTPEAAAQALAQIVHSRGIPIEALDQALARGPQAAPQAQQQPAPAMSPASIRSEIGNMVLESQVKKMLADPPEFLADVEKQMVDIIKFKRSSGEIMSPGDAYNLACQMNPEIRGVLEQREAAKRAATTQVATQRAKDAASSVRSEPAAAIKASQPKTTRDDVEAAWNAAVAKQR